MAGFVKWSRRNDDDWHADVTKCVRIDNQINIVFENLEEGIEGQVSFAAKNGKQLASGRWRYNTKASEGYSVIIQGKLTKASKFRLLRHSVIIQGKLTKFVGQVVFEGIWDEKDGEPCDFYVDAAIA
jgi:hypothetical protein